MEKNIRIILGIIIAVIVIGIIAYLIVKYIPFGERAKFIGTWESEDGNFVYTFFSDGTGIFEGIFGEEKGTWEIKDGKLIIKSDGATNINEYSFLDDSEKLLIDGIIFIKQQ